MHPKLTAAYVALPQPQNDAEALRFATLRGLLYGYHHWWLQEEWHPEAIETEFHLPIVNPDTGRRSRTFEHAGKFDGLISSHEGEQYLLEHKTCSEELGPDASYWKRLTIDTQISAYLLACWVKGQKLNGVLYDVIRKPEIRPRKLTGAERKELWSTQTYCGNLVADADAERCRQDTEFRETPRMFEARLALDTRTRPDWYFARRTIRRLDQEILTYAAELWQTAEEIRGAMRTGDRRRNDRACMAYGRPCEYLDLCARHDTLDSPNWKKLSTPHPELALEDPTDGSRILTHTRIGCFTTCRRKHHYRYELGITRWEEAEPLVFGSLLHQALAAWWTTDAGAEDAKLHRRIEPGAPPPQPRAPARGPRLGEDEPGCSGPASPLPHDEERDGPRHLDPEQPAPSHAVDALLQRP